MKSILVNFQVNRIDMTFPQNLELLNSIKLKTRNKKLYKSFSFKKGIKRRVIKTVKKIQIDCTNIYIYAKSGFTFRRSESISQ